MPNCFQLFKKDDVEQNPVSLVKLDQEICEHLGVETHPVRWRSGWHDTIGWGIAVMGHNLGTQELRDYIVEMPEQFEGELGKILAYLETNYSSRGFYAPKSVMG
jgi:hypothetical protein